MRIGSISILFSDQSLLKIYQLSIKNYVTIIIIIFSMNFKFVWWHIWYSETIHWINKLFRYLAKPLKINFLTYKMIRWQKTVIKISNLVRYRSTNLEVEILITYDFRRTFLCSTSLTEWFEFILYQCKFHWCKSNF